MEPIYIVTIVASSIFLLLLIIFMCMFIVNNKKQRELQNELRKMYVDKNAPKLDYDCAVYDEEVKRKLESNTDGQLTIDDVIQSTGTPTSDETVFASVEVENVEEITGNYQPEK
ncbi:MAG: hypothetical protein J1G05_00700 [Clostridiales bacterium]|nr:hypothetical protein [Clostridiales bacterium]